MNLNNNSGKSKITPPLFIFWTLIALGVIYHSHLSVYAGGLFMAWHIVSRGKKHWLEKPKQSVFWMGMMFGWCFHSIVLMWMQDRFGLEAWTKRMEKEWIHITPWVHAFGFLSLVIIWFLLAFAFGAKPQDEPEPRTTEGR